jgi:serine/threonine protein kinase
VQRNLYSYSSGAQPLDDFTIKRGLGVGGFGEVYFAVSKAGKEVALKKIQRNLDIELRGVQQCLNLNHVNLISLWDIRTNHHDEKWVVMEYVSGPSLRDVVEASPRGMLEPQVKAWFTAIASGVAYLHDKGIVHRDLKPGNIFCDEHSRVVKIGDYGLSKFISSSRRSDQTEAVGTFHYMAPEIGNGIYGKEIDIYALGVVLFEMLSGTVPFDGESAQEIIMKHLTSTPDMSIVSEPFHVVLKKALHKDPKQRYPSVHEMLKDLPWPDVVNNSHKIVSWHTVGAMIHTDDIPRGAKVSPTDVHPTGFAKATSKQAETHYPTVKPTVASASRVIVEDTPSEVVVPDIQFGPVRHGEIPKRLTVLTADYEGPVTRLLGSRFPQFASWWDSGSVILPVKVALLFFTVWVALTQDRWLIPATVFVAALYLVYYLSYSTGSRGNRAVSKLLLEHEARRAQGSLVRKWIAKQPQVDRFTELVGSLLGGAISCIVLNFFGMILSGRLLNLTLEAWSLYLWLTITAITCCWAALMAGKFWEDYEESIGFRQMTMVLVGFGVGVVSYGVSRVLHTDLSSLAEIENRVTFFGPVRPALSTLPACLLMFSVIFGVLRWWRQADPVRRTRVSVWSVGLCMVWAIVLCRVLNLPAVSGCILAFSASMATQFSSPWIHPDKRTEICHPQVASELP